MKPGPVRAAAVARDAQGTPMHPGYGDVYHPRGGALAQAEHVFLRGSGLPGRWAGRARFVVLETGFGLGNNFLATWNAWRTDPRRCERLEFVSVEAEPFARDDLAALHAGSPLAELARQLVAAWPPLTPDLHTMAFEGGRVRLRVAFGDVRAWLPQIAARVDAYFLDGFAPARNPQMWSPQVARALARLAAPEATAATWSAARAVRDALGSAGFEVRAAPGQGGKRDITLARYAPRFVPRRLPVEAVQPSAAEDRRAIVVGAGLAGCAAAHALAAEGWSTTLVDRHPLPAAEASGNPAGLWHAVFHPDDGAHARFGRAAALAARRSIAHAIEHHAVPGSTDGMLQLAAEGVSLAAMRLMLERQGLGADALCALDAAQASQIAGITLERPAWWHPIGGWVRPDAFARALLEQSRPAGEPVRFVGAVEVARVQRGAGGWSAVDAAGRTIAAAPCLVLANAADAVRLLGCNDAPLRRVRGQISWIGVDAARGRALPRLPVSGSGYLLPPLDGRLLFGATSELDDDEALPRLADHARNAAQLARLSPDWAGLSPDALEGRVGWRCLSPDRLPLIGAVAPARAPAQDQPRRVEREAGLFVLTGLGTRGISSAVLGGAMLAAWVAGAPLPTPAALRDATDPARFAVRRWRAAGRLDAGPAGQPAAPPPDTGAEPER